ncbi:MAG: LysR family transcriptional regulator [Oceanospirillales bacterium]|nr:LysR family transcriptional regulator [Oceanospirillales bacterium]
MKIDHVRAFMAVVESGSFRAAAAQLHKTQPTISSSIRVLEDSYDVKLFDRESYRPILTQEGKALYKQARQLMGAVDEFQKLGSLLAKGTNPKLSLSLSAMCTRPPHLDRIREFCDETPDVELNISTEHHSGILERLILGEADLAIGPNLGLNDNFEYADIGELLMVTVAVPEYFHGMSQRTISQKEARERPHILVADSGTHSPFDPLNVLPGERRWLVKDYHVKKELLMAGLGWARMPQYIVDEDLHAGRLARLSIEGFNSTSLLSMYLIKLKDRTLSQTAKVFWKKMTDQG